MLIKSNYPMISQPLHTGNTNLQYSLQVRGEMCVTGKLRRRKHKGRFYIDSSTSREKYFPRDPFSFQKFSLLLNKARKRSGQAFNINFTFIAIKQKRRKYCLTSKLLVKTLSQLSQKEKSKSQLTQR